MVKETDMGQGFVMNKEKGIMKEKILRMKSGKVYRLEGKAQTLRGMSIDYLNEEWINHPDKIIIFEDSEHHNVWTRLGNIEDIENSND